MAGLANTLTQALRTAYPSNYDKYEDRLSEHGALALFKLDTIAPNAVITPDVIEMSKMSMGNTLQIPVIDGDDVTIGNVRSCTIADYENTSQLYTVTFATYAFGFTMVPASYQNNDIKYQADYNRKLLKYLKKFASTLDSAAIAKLEADKTAIMNSPFIGAGQKYGALVGDAIQVTNAQKGLIFNDLTAILGEDDFYGRYNVLGSQTLRSIVGEYANQGAANATNTQFQFGEYDFGYSNRVTVGAGKAATFYAVPKGTLAVLNRNEPDAILGSMINSENYWEEVQVPIVDLTMGVRYFKECANNSTINGGSGAAHLTGSMKETFIWSTDVAFITAYNSDPVTLPSAIFKAEISAS
jgi:hypothetical protein